MALRDVLSQPAEPRVLEATQRNAVLDKLVGTLACDSTKAYRIGLAFVLIFSFELAAAILFTRCPNLNAMVWDYSSVLDGAWRLLQGQKPHVDFYSPLGLLALALVAAGMKIGTPTAAALAYTHAILLPLLVIWAWALLRSRMPAFFSALLSLWIGVLAVAPRSLGWPPPQVSYSMQYNRWGWALLLIAAIEVFIPRRDGNQGALDGVSTGVITGLLLFLKINYFATVVIAVAIRLAWRGIDRKWLAAAAAGGAAVTGCGFWYLNFDIPAFVGDLRLLGSVQTLSGRIAYLLQLTFANVFDLWLLASAMLISGIWLFPQRGSWKARIGWLAAPVSLAALGIITCCANFQKFEIPLIWLAICAVAEQVRRGLAGPQAAPPVAYLAVCLLAVGITGQSLYQDLSTLALAAGGPSAIEARRRWPQFDAAPFGDLRVSPPDNLSVSPDSVRSALRAQAIPWREEVGEAYPYVVWFNDGVHLLRPRIDAHSHVLVMDLSNPFSFALGLTPPRGDSLFWHWSRDFDGNHFPPADRVFREVTHIMVPKSPVHWSAAIILQKIYAQTLADRFHKAAESDLWVLYERNMPLEKIPHGLSSVN